jgi:hypothetical protein
MLSCSHETAGAGGAGVFSRAVSAKEVQCLFRFGQSSLGAV